MKEILLRNRTIRRVVAAGAVIAALGGIAYAEVDQNIINSPAKIQKRAEQLVPGYNPREFEVAQQVIVDFGKQTTGERHERETYNEGRRLYLKMSKQTFHKNFGVVLGSFVVAVTGGVVFLANFPSKAKERIT